MERKPICKLVGTDGNVFSVIGKVSSTLKKVGLATQASEFTAKAFQAENYDEILRLVMEYVEVR